MAVNKVTTSLDAGLWKACVLSGVKWCDALAIGAKLLLGEDMKEKELIMTKAKLRAELEIVENKIQAIHTEQTKNIETERAIKENLGLLIKASGLVLEDISRLRAWTRSWINKTGMKVSNDEFFKLCKRAASGEFDKPEEAKV